MLKDSYKKARKMNEFEYVIDTARQAGEIIMKYYKTSAKISIKNDKSPVTEADIAANSYIVEKLKEFDSSIPVIAEENESGHNEAHKVSELKKGLFWLVDPLDGTKGFIRKDDQFTVNIALIEKQKPVFGVILIPASNSLYFGDKSGAFREVNAGVLEKIKVRKADASKGLDAILSFSHKDPKTEEFLEKYKINNKLSASSSLKFCRIAEGVADIYPRFGRTMEWDTAAGHAILNAAGGKVEDLDGNEFLYAKENFENAGFIAFGNISK